MKGEREEERGTETAHWWTPSPPLMGGEKDGDGGVVGN